MKVKCLICKKKLNILETLTNKCKCDNYYCTNHLFFTNHNCKFDYIEDFKIKSTSNIVDLSCKLEKI
jgi:hypothetical protein